jgi:hypothetical protein
MTPQPKRAQSESLPEGHQISSWFKSPRIVGDNLKLFTDSEKDLMIISWNRGPLSISSAMWTEITGKGERIRIMAINGLREKGWRVIGSGDRVRVIYNEAACQNWIRQPHSHRARTAGRAKSVTAKPGMQIHQECRERGCGRLCENPVIPFPATNFEKPVAQERREVDQKTSQERVPGTAKVSNPRPPESPPPKPPPSPSVPNDLQQLLGIFLSLGVAMSEADTRKCGKIWGSLKSTEKTTALAYATARQEAEWSECAVRYIPRPWNFLGEKHWERSAAMAGRPKTQSKSEKATESAIKMFRDGGIWNQKP